MRKTLLPVAGDALRRLSMQRTLQHINAVSAGDVSYLKPGHQSPTVRRADALAHEERILQTISTVRG